jgi:site-specific recombinase XerD
VKQNGEGIGLKELVDGLLFSVQAEGRSARTVEYYRDKLRLFLDYAREKGWGDSSTAIDSHRVREFLSWTGSRVCEHQVGNGTKLVRKAKPTTAWPYYRCLRRLFNWAVAEGYMPSSPLATIHFKPPPEAPIEGYTIDELKRLLAVCDLDIKTGARFTGIRNKAMLLLFIDSGLRRGELANIRLSDLDLEGGRVRILGKGNKVGVVPFSPKTATKRMTMNLPGRLPSPMANLFSISFISSTSLKARNLVLSFAKWTPPNTQQISPRKATKTPSHDSRTCTYPKKSMELVRRKI